MNPSIRIRTNPKRWIRARLAVGAGLLLLAGVIFGSASTSLPAVAAVVPRVGFHATVLGWSSWYGSYDLGPAGTGWCIDHGLRAPDPAFRYVPTTAGDLDPDRRAAMAWVVSAHGGTNDPIDAAAVMLVLHDLRGASYPFGLLDVDRLTVNQLTGFGGHEAGVINQARAMKAAGRAHQQLRGPITLRLSLAPASAVSGQAIATITDQGGRPVIGALVRIEGRGVSLDSTDGAISGADGSLRRTYRLTDPTVGASFSAHAATPDPTLSALASTTVRAQRVARPAWLALAATAGVSPAPTTTTTTLPATTTTTTTTTRPTTTTTRPTTTTTSTTSVPPTSTSTSTTSTSTPSPSTTTTTPSTTTTTTTEALVPPPAPPDTPPSGHGGALPVTGGPTVAWVALGVGLLLVGGALVAAGRRGLV